MEIDKYLNEADTMEVIQAQLEKLIDQQEDVYKTQRELIKMYDLSHDEYLEQLENLVELMKVVQDSINCFIQLGKNFAEITDAQFSSGVQI